MSQPDAPADHAPLHPCFVVAHMNLTGGNAVQAIKTIRTVYRRDYGREAPPPRALAPAEVPMVEALMLTLSTRQRNGLRRVFDQLDHPEPGHCPACGSAMVMVSADPAPGFVTWCDACEPHCVYDFRHVLPPGPNGRTVHYGTCPGAALELLQLTEAMND